jgi:hypothetical protein
MAVRTLLSTEDRAGLLARMDSLEPEARPRWGRMDAAQMLRHVAECLRMAIGELRTAPLGKRLFHTRLAKHLILRTLPFPKGAPTAPELRVKDAAVFETERSRVRELLQRFADPALSPGGSEHPLFGVLSREEWAELQHKHTSHHLQQFGV